MTDLVECPACEGRGSYCLRVDDGTWSELVILDVPCDMCNGTRKVPYEAVQYNLWEVQPAYPYAELD